MVGGVTACLKTYGLVQDPVKLGEVSVFLKIFQLQARTYIIH